MFQKPESELRIEAASNRVLLAMEDTDPNSHEYETLVNRLSDLNSIKVNNTKSKLSKDALLTVAANLAGIVLILQYERAEIVGSKALTFVKKLM
jgi:hypothetical protein